ncbi:NAD(+)/NADH kinase [Streptomyces atratus]|uniref:Predicted polyphosphate-or ATP-dependent NAD kinase n=1 Tax=Streptomyces atratus TaxID=1893 RepID=A0A1K2C6U1_STRAR|nr:NAD(+)/NADH kinase [Streptomyces atratus]SFY06176.1 Predicted polyphosphate-or ATP-dependent NAD kinase [Streptomyces atratus]
MTRVGLVVNPVAGLGGRVGLGGTDGPDRARTALSLGARPLAGARAAAALGELAARAGEPARDELLVVTAAGPLGAESAAAAGLTERIVYAAGTGRDTSAADTAAAVRAVVAEGVGLLLFAGGDGTARDVLGALGDVPCPVLGVPTGVKMHSAVFAVSPRAAGEVAAAWLARTGRVRVRDAEVMDRDEDALGEGRVTSRLFGWLPVPDVPVRVQQRKTGSSAALPEAVGGIAAEAAERVGAGLLVLGPGSTTRAVAAALGADVSLTGVDVLALRPGHPPRVVARDAGEDALLALGPAWIALSPIGGQGFLLGRGNQQISPRVLRAAGGRERLLVLCTETKLAALGGRPLLLDTGDDALDAELSGHLPVITGRRRTSLYRLAM